MQSDNVQEAFYGAVGGDPTRFEGDLRAAEAKLKRLPNYRSYLACGDEHCILPTPRLLLDPGRPACALRDWTARLSAGGPRRVLPDLPGRR